jgi:hypothetical protein
MSRLPSTANAFINFSRQLRKFLHNTSSYDEIRDKISQQIVNREDNFLNTLQSNVFNYPKSPYLPLFNQANITYKDVERLIGQRGLENTLEELYDAGIYVTFEEFKGRIPIKRGNLELNLKASDFDNPNMNTALYGHTSGSTGAPTQTKYDLEYLAESGRLLILAYGANDILDIPIVIWRGIPPDSESLRLMLLLAHVEKGVERWFTTIKEYESRFGWSYQLLTHLTRLMVRIHGVWFPPPEFISLDDPLKIGHGSKPQKVRVTLSVPILTG